MVRICSLLLCFFCAQVFSDIAVTPEARKDLELTVYNDFGIIKDSRTVNIPQGMNRIRFEGVATGIQSSSVFLEWPPETEIELLGQSYEYDLVSPKKLMEKYIGKELDFIPRKEIWKDSVPKTVELIGVHGEEPVFRVGTRITFGDIGQILFPYVPDNLYTKPTLIWDIQSLKRQDSDLSATYMTDGISWKSGYVLQVDLKKSEGLFSGWITIENKTGMNFKNAHVTVVSGKIHRLDSDESIKQSANNNDYLLYTMNSAVSIDDQQQKQIEWIPQVKVQFKQTNLIDFSSDKGKNFCQGVVWVEIENNEQNGIGLPLPEGVLRIFKKDAKGSCWFVGEDKLNTTPSKKTFGARVYGISDFYGEKSFIAKDGNKDDNYEILLTNKNDSEITLQVKDFIGNEKVLGSSDKYQIRNSSIEWTVTIPPKNTYKIQYRVQKRL